jgi:6-phosphogluconolactonase
MLKKYFLNDEDFAILIANKISRYARKSIKSNNIFNLLLCGGRTPVKIYESLSLLNNNWERWHIWLTDERIQTQQITEFNSDLIFKSLLNRIPFNLDNFHTINNSNNCENDLIAYYNELKNIIHFDVSLIGIGEDGHVASLFPGKYWGLKDDSPDAFIVYDSPKEPKLRITLSANRINLSKNILFVAKGKNKLEVINRFDKDSLLPFNSIRGLDKTFLFYNCNE